MFFTSFKDFLFETQMNTSELLDKPANSGDYSGEWRTSILKKAIETGLELELANGDLIKLDSHKNDELLSLLADNKPSAEEYDKLKAFFKGGKVLIADDGTRYKLTDIKKSDIFGGGSKGSGGGAEDTKKNESLQCVACAIANHLKRDITEEDFTEENIDKVKKKFDISYTYESISDLVKELLVDEKWKKSYILTANELRKQFSSGLNEYHHQSSWVKDLYNLAKDLNKKDNGPFRDLNKWNPADIWILKGKNSLPTEEQSLVELNNWIADKFNEKEAIGVSLKKTSHAHFSIENLEQDANDIGDIDKIDFSISSKNQVFMGKNAYIYFDEDKMQIKSKQTGFSAIQGEILKKSSSAKHGAISLGPMNSILNRMGLDEIYDINKVKSLIDFKESDKQKKYKRLLDEMIDNVMLIEDGLTKMKIVDEFMKSEKTDNEAWVVSKFQAVQLLAILQKAKLDKRKLFIMHAYAYAASKSDLSSVYVKVS
jgi:hypothetical protein